MKTWDQTEIHLLQSSLDLNTKEIYLLYCDQYGSGARTYDSIQKKVKALREAFSDHDEDTDDEAIEREIEARLEHPDGPFIPIVDATVVRRKNQEAQLWLKSLLEETSSYNWKKERKPKPVKGKASTLVIVISDTHFGKQTGGYNLGEAHKRMVSLPKEIAVKQLPEIDEVVILLGGDMVEGEDIYPTQNNHIECSAIEQMQACSAAIWQMILACKDIYKVPVRVETVPGNHGRMSKTANEKTNWDNVVYHVLRSLALNQGDKDIMVNCNFEKFKIFEVKDQRGLLYHKGVKHTGTPAMREKVAGWVKGKQFDFLVHGHWHEWHVGNWLGKFVLSNGCMCGPDDLAEEMAKEDTARQAFFFITPGEPAWGFSFIEWQEEEDD